MGGVLLGAGAAAWGGLLGFPFGEDGCWCGVWLWLLVCGEVRGPAQELGGELGRGSRNLEEGGGVGDFLQEDGGMSR